MTYRADIDGLRAIAILLVIIFHFQLLPFGKSGFIGVDVFFVISGFLITRIILDDLQAGRFRLGMFYYKRFRRLYPALLATLILYLIAGYFTFLPGQFQELATEALLSLGYVVNFYFWRSVNYFGIQAETVPLLHMWSLAIEEQFYLLYPITLLAIWRFARAWLIPLAVLVTLASFALGVFAAGWKPEAAFYLLPTRAWELLMGGLLAFYLTPGRQVSKPVATVLGLAGLGLILLALVLHTPVTRVPGWFTLLPTGGAVLLILAGTVAAAPSTRLLSLAPMVWIGKISYPLYLVHWPILILQRDMVLSYSMGYRLAGFALSFLLAWAIYRFVETPIRHGSYSVRRGLWGLGGATVATGVLAAVVFVTAGLPNRLPEDARLALSYADDAPVGLRVCETRTTPNDNPTCLLGDPEQAPSLLLIGDSHAAHLAPAVDHWLKESGGTAKLVFSSACMPVAGVGDAPCDAPVEGTLAWAETAETIDTVMLVSIWRQPYEKGGLRVNGAWQTGDAAQAGFTQALIATIERLQAAGKRVILVDPMFGAPRHLPNTLAKNLAFGRDWPLANSRAFYEEMNAPLFEAFEAAEATGVTRISLIEDFCDTEVCRTMQDGLPMFIDNNHLSLRIAPVLGEVLAREMAEPS